LRQCCQRNPEARCVAGRREIALRRSDEEDSPQDRLIYELKVHQIELEMQNNELQESQQELQRSRHRYEILFDFAPVAYFVLNSEGGIVEANHAAAGLLQTERRFLDRKPFVVFLANEYHAAFFSHLKRIFEQGNRQTVDIQLNTRQGGLLWARLESRMQRGSRGEPQCLTAILDISDRKKIEDDLIIAREDALSSSRAKSAFLANISHEIRTPMSGILAMSELAMQQTSGDEMRRYIRRSTAPPSPSWQFLTTSAT
jgi:PAS domain S-box-containing protein